MTSNTLNTAACTPRAALKAAVEHGRLEWVGDWLYYMKPSGPKQIGVLVGDQFMISRVLKQNDHTVELSDPNSIEKIAKQIAEVCQSIDNQAASHY